jgi:hypothetical protein
MNRGIDFLRIMKDFIAFEIDKFTRSFEALGWIVFEIKLGGVILSN